MIRLEQFKSIERMIKDKSITEAGQRLYLGRLITILEIKLVQAPYTNRIIASTVHAVDGREGVLLKHQQDCSDQPANQSLHALQPAPHGIGDRRLPYVFEAVVIQNGWH